MAVMVCAVLVYGALLTALWFGQEALLFNPTPLPADYQFALDGDVHQTWVDVPGARLNALHMQLPHPDGVVFFLHGNSANLATWFVNAEYYRRANMDLFMLDYRGYGKSSGHIQTEEQLNTDIRQAWDQIAPLYAGKRRVVFGRSLGSGLAATLAAQVQPEQTVLASAYESMQALAQEKYTWVPKALLRYPVRTDLAVAHLHGGLLLVHGERDTLIAPAHSERLQRIAPQARLVIVSGAGHADLQRYDFYLDAVFNAITGRGN